MDSNPYEKSYRDARERLILRGKDVGQATYLDGIRYCAVEGMLLSDRNIFEEAWSEEIADAILQEHSVMGDQSIAIARSFTCTECERLLLAYSFSNETYREVLHLKIETGALRPLLSDELIAALQKKCEIAREALFDHEKTHSALTGTATSAAI